MLIKDTQTLSNHKVLNSVENHKQQKINWMKEQEADTIYVENEYIDCSNNDRQLGRKLLPAQLEARLKKVNPNFHFEVNAHKPSMKALYIIVDRKKEYIGAYHNEMMPEHSVAKRKEEEIWDYNNSKPLDKADLPKHEWNPILGKYEFEKGALKPGWKIITKPAGELKRGWRTLLLMIVYHKYANWYDVEKVFPETPSSLFGQRAWAYHKGTRSKNEVIIPF